MPESRLITGREGGRLGVTAQKPAGKANFEPILLKLALWGSGPAWTAEGGRRYVSSYSFQRRKSRAPFVPPKPKEFDMAYLQSALRAWLGTKSMPSVSES